MIADLKKVLQFKVRGAFIWGTRWTVGNIIALGFCAALPLLAGKKADANFDNEWRSLEFREPHPQRYFVRESAFDPSNTELFDEEIPGRFGTPTGKEVFFLDRLVLHSKEPINEKILLQSHYIVLDRKISDRLAIFRAVDPRRALEAAIALNSNEAHLAAYPLMRRPFVRHNRVQPKSDDTYLAQSWHVENRDQEGRKEGIDLNLRAAWAMSEGQDVTVAFSDNGMDLKHPDLEARAIKGPHFNFGDNSPSGEFINSDAHGTAVAGVIAAEANNQTGVIGVAPKADLSSLVIFDINRRGREGIVPDDALMDMFEYEIDQIDIQNHSWGSVAEQQSGLDALSNSGIEEAIRNGRNGLGLLMFRAGGNEREFLSNANDDGFSSDPRVILVGATRFDGNVTSYSTPGACLLISAPSGDTRFPGIATTDHQGADGYVTRGRGDIADYLLGDAGFSGTSASSPIAAGIGALILGVNPSLSYRDVQQILIHASVQQSTNDPDLEENAAGFRFSHHSGYGVPNAAYALELAKQWKPRPDFVEITETLRPNRTIPDQGLELAIEGANVPSILKFLPVKPSLGVFAKPGMAAYPIVSIGDATQDSIPNLTGQAALIRRGTITFAEKIQKAFAAGAKLAIIHNNVDETEIATLGGTGFSNIPAVSISQQDGEALLERFDENSNTTARILLNPAVVEFDISDSLSVEHVGIEINTTHSFRGDLRVTLTSPKGTTSILQTYNLDSSPGPRAWTYWSVKHFYESSVGTWKLAVLDQAADDIGSITSASLIIRGTPILDIDSDGLDDQWERLSLGSLNFGPKADPDSDGMSNAREQVLQSDPKKSNRPLRLEISRWAPTQGRLTWPARDGLRYQLFKRSELTGVTESLASLEGQFPEGETIIPLGSNGSGSFFVHELP